MNKEIKMFGVKLSLFLFPFIAYYLIELFVLPIDFFTFRVWEALVVRNYFFATLLPGPFYPDMKITKVEEGDLAVHTKWSVKKKTFWQTDRFGFRKGDADARPDDIVIIGDSYTAGQGLSQEAILSEVLERKLKVGVYPFAPADINLFLRKPRFQASPPKTVILEAAESAILSLPSPRQSENTFITKIIYLIEYHDPLQPVVVLADRISKANLVQYLNSNIFTHHEHPHVGSEFFLWGDDYNRDVSLGKIESTIQTIKAYNKIFSSQHIRFIFLPIPCKENIYYELLPSKKKATFLGQLIPALKDAHIEVVNTQSGFEAMYARGIKPYISDDTHWNEAGVNLTADLIIDELRKPDNVSGFDGRLEKGSR
jgi:alginate O-acetyltransferase complex protein AlgJ